MSALAYSTLPEFGDAAALAGRLRAKFGPLATVIAAHAVLFYLISSGLLDRVVQVAMPQAVLVSFVSPPAPPPPAAAPLPKTVVLAQLPPPITPPMPVVQIAPLANAITLPQPAPAAPAEPVPVMVAAVSAAAGAPAPGPKTITSGVEYIQPPQPVYPTQSKRMGEQGKVILRILVNEKGLPDQVIVQSSSGSARLDEAGRQAALRALFKPHLEDGRPVAVFVIVPLNFQLAS
jgi:protein TonB